MIFKKNKIFQEICRSQISPPFSGIKKSGLKTPIKTILQQHIYILATPVLRAASETAEATAFVTLGLNESGII